MLTSGTDRATPIQQMWPLLCNEIGLSYDQEEKFRSFQKGVIQEPESWVDRHRDFASGKAIKAAHDGIQALILRTGQRESSTLGILSTDQRSKFMAWAAKSKERVSSLSSKRVAPTVAQDQFQVSKEQHVAANLYILNHRLDNLLQKVPRAAPIVTGQALKKLSVRPSFESLGAQDEKCPECPMSREDSFVSAGSLNMQESEMNTEDDDKVPTQITPQEAQEAAQPALEKALGHVKSIMPLPPVEYGTSHYFNPIPDPSPYLVSSACAETGSSVNYINCAQTIGTALPAPVSMNSMEHSSLSQNIENGHQRQSSFLPNFLPANLNVVPEEMWPDETDEFLMDLGDWAIGEGIDMDHAG